MRLLSIGSLWRIVSSVQFKLLLGYVCLNVTAPALSKRRVSRDAKYVRHELRYADKHIGHIYTPDVSITHLSS